MWVIKQLADEWRVISDAPLSTGLIAIAALLIAYGFLYLLFRREVSALKAEKSLAERVGVQLNKENEEMSKKLVLLEHRKEPPTVNAVRYGGEPIKALLFEIEEKKTHRFYGHTSDWQEPDMNKFALFSRLRELGAVHVQQQNWPTTSTTVLSTSTATDIVAYIKLDDIKFKKP